MAIFVKNLLKNLKFFTTKYPGKNRKNDFLQIESIKNPYNSKFYA